MMKEWLARRLLGEHWSCAAMPSFEAAANDNCFWRWLFGPYQPFDSASEMRQRIEKLRAPDADYSPADKEYLIRESKLFLELFRYVCIEQDLEKAKQMAPRLNRSIPWLMQRCPDKELRPE